MHANHREELEEIDAGDIAAAVGLKSRPRATRLRSRARPIVLERMNFPEPVIEVAIEPKTKGRPGQARRSPSQQLAEEDPTFRVKSDEETGQTIIAGMGETPPRDHRRTGMLREFKVDANVGKPQVAYRETVSKRARSEGKFVRQTGGKGQYGHVVIKLRSQSRAPATSSRTRSSAAPSRRSTSPRSTPGITEALQTGVFAGYPVVDVKVTLFDGSYHEVDSSEMAFKIAGSMAVKDALQAREAELCSSP